MNRDLEKRMCWNCEGDVSMHLTQCPYCRAFLQDPVNESIETSIASQDFYSQKKDPFNISSEEWNNKTFNQKRFLQNEQETSIDNEQLIEGTNFLSIGSLFFGISLLLFGFMIFFSTGGMTLTFSKAKAIYYLLGGGVFSYFGYKFFNSSS